MKYVFPALIIIFLTGILSLQLNAKSPFDKIKSTVKAADEITGTRFKEWTVNYPNDDGEGYETYNLGPKKKGKPIGKVVKKNFVIFASNKDGETIEIEVDTKNPVVGKKYDTVIKGKTSIGFTTIPFHVSGSVIIEFITITDTYATGTLKQKRKGAGPKHFHVELVK